MLYLKGGVASGFKAVEPESYSPRLLQMSGKGTNVRVREVDLDPAFVNSTDVFILDKGYVCNYLLPICDDLARRPISRRHGELTQFSTFTNLHTG